MQQMIPIQSRPLSQQQAAIKARSEALDVAMTWVRSDPELARSVAEGILAELNQSEQSKPTPSAPRNPQAQNGSAAERPLTQYERVRRYFLSNGNDWATTAELLQGTDLDRSQLSTIFYKKHKNKFVAEDLPDSSRQKRWKLRDDLLGKTTS